MHDDGCIHNFSHYQLENGVALWIFGEHFRYTRDREWIRTNAAKIIRASDYIIRWRERNKREELRGKGYGMIDGMVGDPVDPYRHFMLNGYAYLGLSRAAEILSGIDDAQSKRLKLESEALKADIRHAFSEAMALSPVVPLGDGTWCPAAPPWPGVRGPAALLVQGGRWFTHGSFFCRDSLVGPMYLIFTEVLGLEEPAADWLLKYHSEFMCIRNVALSQPYYSRHPWVHLRRGHVKPFLKAYYNGFSGLADRETYTFWEHYFGASPHKTHEEAWFLMQTRWMLYMEQGRTLKLLAGIPRVWLRDGEQIELKNVASYFGHVNLYVKSALGQGRIEATIECDSERRPECVELRLPHPDGGKAVRSVGGQYDLETETVSIAPFQGRARIILCF